MVARKHAPMWRSTGKRQPADSLMVGRPRQSLLRASTSLRQSTSRPAFDSDGLGLDTRFARPRRGAALQIVMVFLVRG